MRKISGIIMIIAGCILVTLFVIEGVKIQMEDPSLAFQMQYAYGQDIASIKSVGGRTLEEAFYQSYGQYLSRQSEISKSMYNTEKSTAMIFIYIGVMLSLSCACTGLWILLSGKAVAEKLDASIAA